MADLALANAVNTPKPLFNSIRIPRQIVIQHQMRSTVQVDALARRIRRHQHQHLRIVLKGLLDLTPPLAGSPTVNGNHRVRVAQSVGQLIHKHLAANLGAEVLLDLENHHNFAWKERHVIAGVEKEVIVHRKGATPAGEGVLGIIPGSMASPGFVVSGKGNPESLNSASHGAGRVMSRTQATKTFEWKKVNAFLREKGVTLISAGLDEVPMVYKNIHEVMAAQNDLVTILGQFDPKLVKMAPHGERAED